MMPGGEASALLKALREDRSIWAIGPCGHEYRLSASQLFYGSEIPESGKTSVLAMGEELKSRITEVAQLAHRLSGEFTQRSAEIKLGMTIEKVVPALPGFPLARADCRPIFDPIDYLGFLGLTMGRVSRVEFIDVRAGTSRPNAVQRSIKDVVEDGKVTFRELRE